MVRLGILKEMQPVYVATFSEKPAVLEGHPFIVEAGVSLGGAAASGPIQLGRLTLIHLAFLYVCFFYPVPFFAYQHSKASLAPYCAT